MPNSVIKLLNLVGVPTDRDWGHALLCTIGQWDPNAPTFHESPWELQQRLQSRANEGARRQVGDIALTALHTIAASFLPFKYVDCEFAEQVINYNLMRFPNSSIFTYLKGRRAQVDTRLEEAIKIYDTAKLQTEYRNVGHSMVFEQVMCGIMLQDHDLACTKSRVLLRESNWSKATFRYLAAITTLVRGLPHEAPRVLELMKKVELGVQSFCGVEVFTETFCARKANRFLNEGHLLLPDYDFLMLWNGFDMMPMVNLRVALSRIMVEVQRLEELLPASMKAIAEVPIPRGGYTLEASKGILNSIRSSIHTLTKADKVPDYEHFYDDYCLAHYLLGSVAQRIALFPEEPFDVDMCALAVKSFKTVFRYAPYIKDDTYTYYLSHYSIGIIMMSQGKLDHAEEKFKYLLNTINPTVTGLTTILAGKGRNSFEFVILGKSHSAMYLLNEDRASSTGSPCTSANGKSSPVSSESFYDGAWTLSSMTAIHINDINTELNGLAIKPEAPVAISPMTSHTAASMVSVASLTKATPTSTTPIAGIRSSERVSITTSPHSPSERVSIISAPHFPSERVSITTAPHLSPPRVSAIAAPHLSPQRLSATTTPHLSPQRVSITTAPHLANANSPLHF
ncbi:hypothetical protein BGZ76_002845 [Entomortierella beljakovae]|nr:hypothetical protein BGZ76_002845 [Entomortierella beljakovae]